MYHKGKQVLQDLNERIRMRRSLQAATLAPALRASNPKLERTRLRSSISSGLVLEVFEHDAMNYSETGMLRPDRHENARSQLTD